MKDAVNYLFFIVYAVVAGVAAMPVFTFISVRFGIGCIVWALVALLGSVFFSMLKKRFLLAAFLAISFTASVWGSVFTYWILPGLM